MITDDIIHIVQRYIQPRFIFVTFAVVFSGQIQEWADSNVSNYLWIKTTLSSQKKTGQNRFQVKKGEHIPHIMK